MINGEKKFRNFCGDYISYPINTKEAIKKKFNYVNMEFPDIKTYARNYK